MQVDGMIVLVVLFLAVLSCVVICLYESISSFLRDFVSSRRLEKKGYVRKLVSHEGESSWENDSGMIGLDTDFRKGGNCLKRKRLDKELLQELDGPSRRELDKLKVSLRITSGCLCYKHGAIYLVTCEGKKRRWMQLGRWQELRRAIERVE